MTETYLSVSVVVKVMANCEYFVTIMTETYLSVSVVVKVMANCEYLSQ
jgi:hypothetical protein